MEINLCMGCMKEKTQPGPCPHCGFDEAAYEPLPHHLPPETILYGKYLIGKVMGEGGFGITYVGWDLNLATKVAIKEYFPQSFVSRENSRSNTVTLLTGYQAEFFSSGEVFSALILVALLLSAAFLTIVFFYLLCWHC